MAQQTFNDTKINVEFEPTSNRQQLASGDALPTLFGKISKTMSDLKPVAFSGDYNDLTEVPIFVEGANIAITKNEETNEVTIAADINKETLGLGNVDNTADANKNVKYATSAGSAAKATQDASGNVITSTYAKASDLTSHTGNTNNPHSVTKAQVGLGNVPNVATNDQTPTYTVASSNSALTSGEKLSVAMGKIAKAMSSLISHLSNTSNPHSVTKSQVGLGNVENKSSATIRGELTKSNVTTALGYTPPTTNTTYSVATSSALGLVKSGTDITVDSSGNVSVNDDSHNHVISNIDGLQTTLDGKAASSHTHSSYVNQNAFSNVKVGSTTISADSATDTLTLVAGSNVTITPDTTNDKVSIASNHPTITKSTNSTSTASPSAGGTFTVIDSVTQDSNGHVTKVNTKTVTLPSTSITVDSALSSTSTNPVRNKVINSALSGKVNTSSVLSTVEECSASTTATDVAGASALSELNDSLSLVGEREFHSVFSTKLLYSTVRATVTVMNIGQYNVELVHVKASNATTGTGGEWVNITSDSLLDIVGNDTLMITSSSKYAEGSPAAIKVKITPKT